MGSIAGRIKSFIISGAAGVGKTFMLEQKLQEADDAGQCNFEALKGKCSAIGLYMKMHELKEKGDILLLDDIDVFGNEDVLNLLKAALDTGERRVVSWQTASTYLEDQGIPLQFEFEGTVIFITNGDLDKEIERGTKIAPHVDALLSRSIYLDLGVHTKREILCRVKEVVYNTDMMEKLGCTENDTEIMMKWVTDNVDGLRNVSIRTMLHLSDMYLTDPTDWQDSAEVTLLRPIRRRA